MKEQDKRLVEQEEATGLSPEEAQFIAFLLEHENDFPDTFFVYHWCVDIVGGDLKAGTLLSRIIDLYEDDAEFQRMIERDGKLWLVRGRDDWWDECRLSPHEYDRAIKVLSDAGLVEKRIFKVDGNPTTCIWLNGYLIVDLLQKAGEV